MVTDINFCTGEREGGLGAARVWREHLAGAVGPAAGRPPLPDRGRLHHLRVPGQEETLPQRHLQPAEAGAAGAPPRARLYHETAQRGETHLVSWMYIRQTYTCICAPPSPSGYFNLWLLL